MAESSTCADCKINSGKAKLSCKKHSVCNDCLLQRVEKQPEEVLKCEACKPVLTPQSKQVVPSCLYTDVVNKPIDLSSATKEVSCDKEPSILKADNPDPKLPGIYIFVDDSNIWIGAKKLHSRLKGYKTGEDHRVRIDMGKVAVVLANRRTIKQGILYGSEPPPNDTLWNKIREKGFQVKSEHRHVITGKEKKVDTGFVADITATAIRTPQDQRTTIIVVTGDADVIPAIKIVIEEEHWKIEVYMWKQSLSQDLKNYATSHPKKVEVTPLDKYFNKIAFINTQFDKSNKEAFRRVKPFSVVLSMKAKAFKNHIPSEKWINKLESISRWPVQYYWFETEKQSPTDDLVITFKPDDSAGEFDVAKFLSEVNASDKLEHVKKVQTFQQYIDQEFIIEKIDIAPRKVGILDPDDIDTGHDDVTVCTSEGEIEWSRVVKKGRPKRQRYSEECPHGLRCPKGTQCHYHHSEEDKAYFRPRKGGCGNPHRKTQLCKNKDRKDRPCSKSKKDCDYAHGEDDGYCMACQREGHFEYNCRKKNSSN